ncbi:MAG: hypothetical protein LAO78_09155 [Acidobacteriia bacterium]|nr:hypothetical protein [Terriglobia bacterium]
MRAHGTLVRAVICIAAAVLFLVLFTSRRVLADDASRPIASMTSDERMRLPDNTTVTLKTGRTATLGTLRTEHRARLERFTRATALGQTVATKLSASKPGSIALSPAAKGTLAAAQVRSLVPFKIPFIPIPKDYADFCKAASASVCVYFPANTVFTLGNYSFPGEEKLTWVQDVDPFIIDNDVCHYDGGILGPDGCQFVYPLADLANFKPTGPLTSEASCDPPAKYVVDPKGAAQASYHSSTNFVTGSTPLTCVVQVWIGK